MILVTSAKIKYLFLAACIHVPQHSRCGRYCIADYEYKKSACCDLNPKLRIKKLVWKLIALMFDRRQSVSEHTT
jgi:hypothetical protein